MINKKSKTTFPSQIVSDSEKHSYNYGLQIAKAIENEWFGVDSNRYSANQRNFHTLRLYARGEQGVQKYKDELSINGDLSYLNLDWKPVPIIPKFVDIVVNGMADRSYDIKAFSQDPHGVAERTEYMDSILRDMYSKDINNMAQQSFGINLYENDPSLVPDNEDELAIHMQLDYKQAIEIAEEQAINTLLEGNSYDLVKKRMYYDLTVLGVGAIKNNFNTSQGITVDYVDPANLIWSHTDSPYFEDIYYVGEVKNIPINELKKQFPNLTNEDLLEITNKPKNNLFNNNAVVNAKDVKDNVVSILYFNYKTYMNDVYKVKKTASGGSKIIPKDDTFNPPHEDERFKKLSKSIEVLYDGALILGTKKLLKWELAKNMMRPKSDYTKVKMNYSIVAPRIYKGKIESLVKRITGFADMIQLAHLKLQQVLARMVPDGVYLDADGIAEVDLGNGTNYNPQEALNMFFQTGSVIGRSLNVEGENNPGKVPIQEITSGAGGNKLGALIQTYNYYLQMIRDVTGLNEARDASTPDKDSLVGIQKLAAANSNTATRHILQSGLFLTAELAECLSLRISDILEHSPTKDAFIQAIGSHNVGTLQELKNLSLHDFGIFIELQPDEEEKQLLENNIQAALAKNSIELEDAIDVRDIKNLKLANQLLKIRRKKKLARDEMLQQQNIQAQAQANAQTQQVAAQAEIEKNKAIAQNDLQLESTKAQLDMKKQQQEALLKKDLMNHEFQINMRLRQMEIDALKQKETNKEDRKDERTRIQASQQSELIDQRSNQTSPKDFESTSNDILSGDFDLGMFEPR